MNTKDSKIATQLVHAGVKADPVTGAVLTPIYQNTTYEQESVEKYLEKGFSYSRSANPTVNVLQEKIAIIEGGFGASCFSSGMAATTTLMGAFLKPGDHCVITNCSYGGTNRAARVFYSKYNIEFDFVDFSDYEAIKKAIKPNTRMLFSETPTNPTLNLADLNAISDLARAQSSKADGLWSERVLHVCDSTFATPVIMRALDFGVDIVVQSTTKYYDGHNVTVGGALIAKTEELDTVIKFHQNVFGNIMSPQIAFYTLQSMKTMELRVRQQSMTAMQIALFLQTHAKVTSVCYPGLPSHPQHALALSQHKGGLHGGMVAFEVVGGTAEGTSLMNSVRKPWTLCENLGASESIITCPSVMTHGNMLREDRLKVGITDGFIRLSCGLEDCEELIEALKSALDSL